MGEHPGPAAARLARRPPARGAVVALGVEQAGSDRPTWVLKSGIGATACRGVRAHPGVRCAPGPARGGRRGTLVGASRWQCLAHRPRCRSCPPGDALAGWRAGRGRGSPGAPCGGTAPGRGRAPPRRRPGGARRADGHSPGHADCAAVRPVGVPAPDDPTPDRAAGRPGRYGRSRCGRRHGDRGRIRGSPRRCPAGPRLLSRRAHAISRESIPGMGAWRSSTWSRWIRGASATST